MWPSDTVKDILNMASGHGLVSFSESLNLAYVCFSRAMQDLRIILFTENPTAAKQELINKKWFRDEQVTIQEIEAD